MAADLPTFRLLFPEFPAGTSEDTRIQFWIDRAVAYLNPDSWGDCLDDATLYWAAHKLALSNGRGVNDAAINGSGSAGVIQSASVDGVSTSFAVSKVASQGNEADTQYNRTPYGQQFLALRRSCVSSGRLAGTRARQVL